MSAFRPKKILVLLDSQPGSRTAWKLGTRFAAAFGARIEGLHVQTRSYDPVGLAGFPESPDRPKASVPESVRRLVGPKAKVSAVLGDVIQVAPDWAVKNGFDLIVLGSHGRAGVLRALLGSIAQAVVSRSRVPVLIARVSDAGIRRVVAPVSLERRARRGLDAAAAAALALGARLEFVHATGLTGAGAEETRALRLRLGALIAALPPAVRAACRPTFRLAGGRPARAVIASAQPGDLAVLTASKSRWGRGFVLGTTTERVIWHSPEPVLCVPARG